MSEEFKGQFGNSGVGFDVKVDDQLNVSLGASVVAAEGTFKGASLAMQGSVPLTSILDAAAAASKNSTVQTIESWLVDLLKQYEASKAAAAAPAAQA